MVESSPFLISEDGGTLRIAWDNRRVRKDHLLLWFIIFFWIIWAPLTLLATSWIFLLEDPLYRIIAMLWSVFGWVGTIGIPFVIIGRTWSEWIEISSESASIGTIGFLARKPKTMPLDTIVELGCGQYSDSEGKESNVTLSIMQSVGFLGGKKRHLVGFWLAPELKNEIFESIENFVKRNQIPLRMVRYGP
jgi:hypothetical protein